MCFSPKESLQKGTSKAPQGTPQTHLKVMYDCALRLRSFYKSAPQRHLKGHLKRTSRIYTCRCELVSLTWTLGSGDARRGEKQEGAELRRERTKLGPHRGWEVSLFLPSCLRTVPIHEDSCYQQELMSERSQHRSTAFIGQTVHLGR